MVILLKLVCFSLWMTIMIFLIIGSRRRSISAVREVKLYVQDDDDIEMLVRKAFLCLRERDRLIIEDMSPDRQQKNSFIISRIMRKNPSILYCSTGQRLTE